MTKEKANEILMIYKDCIPNKQVAYFKSQLEMADEQSYDSLLVCKTCDTETVLLLSVFLGSLGVDRFYIKDIFLGIAKLLLGWFTFGLYTSIDIFFSYKKAKEKNLINLLSCLQK